MHEALALSIYTVSSVDSNEAVYTIDKTNYYYYTTTQDCFMPINYVFQTFIAKQFIEIVLYTHLHMQPT